MLNNVTRATVDLVRQPPYSRAQARISLLGQTLPVPPGGPSITIRRAKQEDAPVCGRICFDAFYGISTKHGFPPDWPSPDVAIGLLSTMFSHRSSTAWWRSETGAWWEATVSMSGPYSRYGIEHSRSEHAGSRCRPEIDGSGTRPGPERNFPGVRLLQSMFHNRSLAMYSRLGFDAREPVSVMQGPPLRKRVEGC